MNQYMEILFTYGWAILVVLVAVGALVYFGAFGEYAYTPSKCSCKELGYDYLKTELIQENRMFIECYDVDTYIDFDNKRITVNEIITLFECVNNTMVVI